ncbi:ATP-binding cassette domain-containing protein [Treponema pedis]|uniref:ATP-binding cassette domain-containing protein n=1 Tax=Treponema pedis TaxID=409322 RepID=UPI003D25A150
MNYLELNNLIIQTKNKILVDGVNFSIDKNETLAIIGESGSGKTITALSIMGLLDKSTFSIKGSCIFNDTELFTLKEEERKKMMLEEISMIYQNPFRSLSPVEKIKTHIKNIYKIKNKKINHEYLGQLFTAVNLTMQDTLNKYPHELSGGELQRVMILFSILFKPKLLICDEPTASLDYNIGLQIISLLENLKNKTGMSILFISHDISIVKKIADRIVIMNKGKIMEEGKNKDIFNSPKNMYTKMLINASMLEK